MTNEQLLEQVQALKELISIQKQTIEALKAQPSKIEYRYSPWYIQNTPYYTYQGYQQGAGGTYQQGANANSTVTSAQGAGSSSTINTELGRAAMSGLLRI